MSTFSIYSKFIVQLVLSLAVCGSGIGMIFKDLTNRGTVFWLGIELLTGCFFLWLPNPVTPKTNSEVAAKYKTIFDSLKQANADGTIPTDLQSKMEQLVNLFPGISPELVKTIIDSVANGDNPLNNVDVSNVSNILNAVVATEGVQGSNVGTETPLVSNLPTIAPLVSKITTVAPRVSNVTTEGERVSNVTTKAPNVSDVTETLLKSESKSESSDSDVEKLNNEL